MPRSKLALALAAVVLTALPLPSRRAEARDTSALRPASAASLAPIAPAAASSAPIAPTPLGPMMYDPTRGVWVASMGGTKAVLTIDPQLQDRIERFLSSRRVPAASVVLMEPRTGRILALAEHTREPSARGLAFRAVAPAASVFKIVTTSALLEQGVQKDAEVCFHGGHHRLAPKLLNDDPRRDRKCYSLGEALGHSANVVFAKLSGRGLFGPALRAEASRFLFNSQIPFPYPVEISRADIPDGGFALAETAAGFGQVRMSPLHGAIIASAIANGGVLVPPRIVASVDGAAAPAAGKPQRMLDPQVASALAEMMRTTVTEGTARKAFRLASSIRSPLRGVTIAGKTGSLAERSPYRDYTWFVGFAGRGEIPEIAIAVVIVNEQRWSVRATGVAQEALAAYFDGERRLPRVRTASR